MIQIFLSYAREDYAAVRRLYTRLRDAGYKPWMDKVDLLPGEMFAKAIPKVIGKCDFFIVCLSSRSVVKRSFVQREIKIALDAWNEKLEGDLYIFPVRLDECEAPEGVRDFHWVDLFGDEHEDEWQKLLRALSLGAERLGKAPALPPTTNPPATPPAEIKPASPLPTPPITKVEAKPDRVVVPKSFTETINGVPLELILVPAGKFMMGGDIYDDERPLHEVSVPSFYIGKFQITQKQWKAVMGEALKPRFKGSDLPMESISWNDAQAFCEKLRAMTGKVYRLPSEAEWEYACRAGTTGDYAGKLDEMAWYNKNADSQTHLVGQKNSNAFGLYDMHGNVWEWCEDIWHSNYKDAPNDGSAWTAGGNSKYRVLRGGSWLDLGSDCRSAFRIVNDPVDRYNYVSVRVVVSARTS